MLRYAGRMAIDEGTSFSLRKRLHQARAGVTAHHPRSIRASQLGLGIVVCLLLSACATTTTPRAPEAAPTRAAPSVPGQLAMRNPDDFQPPSSKLGVGVLEATAASYQDERRTSAPKSAEPQLTPIRLAQDPRHRPYPLRAGELVLPSGLVVHRVPKGIVVRTAREQRTGDLVWEIADPRGRRLALLKERSFRRAAAATAPVLDETATLRLEARRDDWDATPVRVVVDRFRAEHHIYTLERRASGTGWIMSNLELTKQVPVDRRVD